MIKEKETKFYLGIDWGEKRIGLALADDEIRLATPFKTVESMEELLEIMAEEGVDVAVVGQPIKMGGEKEALYPLFMEFLKEFKKKADIKIELVDERLTSKEADKLPGERKVKASRDEISAALILQTYLDKLGI